MTADAINAICCASLDGEPLWRVDSSWAASDYVVSADVHYRGACVSDGALLAQCTVFGGADVGRGVVAHAIESGRRRWQIETWWEPDTIAAGDGLVALANHTDALGTLVFSTCSQNRSGCFRFTRHATAVCSGANQISLSSGS